MTDYFLELRSDIQTLKTVYFYSLMLRKIEGNYYAIENMPKVFILSYRIQKID